MNTWMIWGVFPYFWFNTHIRGIKQSKYLEVTKFDDLWPTPVAIPSLKLTVSTMEVENDPMFLKGTVGSEIHGQPPGM